MMQAYVISTSFLKMLMRNVCVILCLSMGSYGAAEPLAKDLLGDDDFAFEAEPVEPTDAWWNDFTLAFEQAHEYQDEIRMARSRVALSYESALWHSSYLKFEDRLTYFWHEDRLAQGADSDYINHELKELWLQQSYSQCSFKLGRQNILWGVVEGTFATDVISPFDYTEMLLTDFASIRRTQDLLSSECYWDENYLQVLFQPRARLDVLLHKNNKPFDELEDDLNEEWGLKYQFSTTGFDIALMYARLYDNTPAAFLDLASPTGIHLDVSRFDFFGVSAAMAIDRLLLELDLGFKKDQLISFSERSENQIEVATGFEYTTSSNHNINMGIWSFVLDPGTPGRQEKRLASTTLGWSKSYLKNDLSMSLLGGWIRKVEQSTVTVQAAYKLDDYTELSGALAYSEEGEVSTGADTLTNSGWRTSLIVKCQF